MRISDWSSDVCSSDLAPDPRDRDVRIRLRRMGTVQRCDPAGGDSGGGLSILGHLLECRNERPAAGGGGAEVHSQPPAGIPSFRRAWRSEERRVGKELSVRVAVGGGRRIKKKNK